MIIAMAAMGQHTTRVSEPIKVMTYNVRHCAGMDLVGDWNDTPDSELVCELQRAFTILSSPEVSYPADQPLECLDYVASYKNRKTRVLKSVVIDEPEASDHRPVVVTLQVLAPILY